jgi:N-acetylmuramoyl-L-alanine amidase
VPEYRFNLAMAEQLKKTLATPSGWNSLILRRPLTCLTLKQRPALAKEERADIFLSVHHNSIEPVFLTGWSFNGRKLRYCDDYPGFSVYFSDRNGRSAESRRLAECIGAALRRAGFPPHIHPRMELEGKNIVMIDRETGLYQYDNLAVLRHADMPAVLLECGMIIDRNEEIQLGNPERIRKMSEAVRHGIEEYWRKNGV